jgi:hypothetical protein
MDRLNVAMVRASFAWLLAGILVGGLMLIDRAVPGDWRRWGQPTHGHMLFVGWFLQFALGIAYWLLPRRRTTERPLGYNERAALLAVAGLNLGLLLRTVAEPAERVGIAQGTPGGWVTLVALTASAALQVGAVTLFVIQLWSRVTPRAPKGRPAGPATTEGQPEQSDRPS